MTKYIVCLKNIYYVVRTDKEAERLKKAWADEYLYTIEIDT